MKPGRRVVARQVVVKDGRLMLKKSPPTVWRTIEIPKCDRCGVIATWGRASGAGEERRCSTCPRGVATDWQTVERLRCDVCGVIATWVHPAGRRRCNTCPRPER